MAIANYKSFITRLGKMICKNFTDSEFVKTEFDDEFNSNTAYFTINGYSAWACIYDDDDVITVYVAGTHTVEIKIDGTQKDAMATAVRRIESLLDEAEIKKAEIDKKAEEEVNADKQDKQEAAEKETAKQYFVVNYEKDGIFHANIASAEKKSDVEAKYSEYDAFAVVEANDYIVKEAKIKHMPIIEVEPVKQEGRNKMESVKPLSIKVERAISKMALGDCTLTGVTELSDYCHDIYVTIETGKDRYELKVILKRNIDGVTTIAIVEDGADEATHVFTDKGCKSLDAIAYHTKMLVDGMYAQRMFDMSCEITDPEYFEEHKNDVEEEEQVEEKEQEIIVEEEDENEVMLNVIRFHLESTMKRWYEDVELYYGISGRFLDCKAEGDNLLIFYEEKGKKYITRICSYKDYTPEQIYNIWMEADGCEMRSEEIERFFPQEVEEPQPTPEEADREVTYIDFKPEQDYSEEEQKEIAETVTGVGLELLEKELTELEKLEEESDKADDAWDKDPLNAELEVASSKAYEKEWKKYMDSAKTLARLINMDTKTAKQMLQRGSKNREKVWNYLKRMKVYENK